MAGLTGLEPATSCVTGRRSNQLNYNPATAARDAAAAPDFGAAAGYGRAFRPVNRSGAHRSVPISMLG